MYKITGASGWVMIVVAIYPHGIGYPRLHGKDCVSLSTVDEHSPTTRYLEQVKIRNREYYTV